MSSTTLALKASPSAPPEPAYLQDAQLWAEEPQVLRELAARIPDGGILVEIGTAQGGTARLFYDETASRGVRIFTIDPTPTARALANLGATSVKRIALPSSEAAKIWPELCGEQIDFLYIDGDHRFHHIYEDFFVWQPYLRVGSHVAFHDYDPPERGGLAHFGIRVFLDTLRQIQGLSNFEHKYRILSSQITDLNAMSVPIAACFETFVNIGSKIQAFHQRFQMLTEAEKVHALLHRTLEADSVQYAYTLDILRESCYELLDNSAKNQKDFRKISEALSMWETAFGPSAFPVHLERINIPADSTDLSGIICREQVRLMLLGTMLASLTNWTP